MKERLEAEIINGAIAIKSGRETVMSFTGAVPSGLRCHPPRAGTTGSGYAARETA